MRKSVSRWGFSNPLFVKICRFLASLLMVEFSKNSGVQSLPKLRTWPAVNQFVDGSEPPVRAYGQMMVNLDGYIYVFGGDQGPGTFFRLLEVRLLEVANRHTLAPSYLSVLLRSFLERPAPLRSGNTIVDGPHQHRRGASPIGPIWPQPCTRQPSTLYLWWPGQLRYLLCCNAIICTICTSTPLRERAHLWKHRPSTRRTSRSARTTTPLTPHAPALLARPRDDPAATGAV